MNGYLPGFEPPPSPDWKVLAQRFAERAAVAPTDFNSFRRMLGLADVPGYVGSLVATACRRRGLVPVGTTRAVLPRSARHLLAVWGQP